MKQEDQKLIRWREEGESRRRDERWNKKIGRSKGDERETDVLLGLALAFLIF
jgi:hypothetical protein